jgi:hypothetical protein
MTNIKNIITKLKKIAKVDSNIELANYFNISYNTLNTWIKRGKIPQDILLDFCTKNNCSLDYILLNKELDNTLFSVHKEQNENKYIYYGEFKELNISFKSILFLDQNIYQDGAYYLIYKNGIYKIARVTFDIFDKSATVNNKTLSLDDFKKINKGLIKEITK